MSWIDYFIIIAILIMVGWVISIAGDNLFNKIPAHKSFCESIGLEWEGYPSGKYDSADAIACKGINPNKTAIFKVFLYDEQGYYEVKE